MVLVLVTASSENLRWTDVRNSGGFERIHSTDGCRLQVRQRKFEIKVIVLFHRENDQGVTIYGGVTSWGMQVQGIDSIPVLVFFQLTKVISTTGYILFLCISTPMCAACVYKLREAQRFNVSVHDHIIYYKLNVYIITNY